MFTALGMAVFDRAVDQWQAFETRIGHFEVARHGPHSWQRKTSQVNNTGLQLIGQAVVNSSPAHATSRLE